MKLDVTKTVVLTPSQEQQWSETLTAFSWHACAFTHVLYEMLNPSRGRQVATFVADDAGPDWFLAGTNGRRVFLNANKFFKLTLQERIFVLAHEVCHGMLGHIVAGSYYRKKGTIDLGFKSMVYVDELANIAQDYVINDMLIESRIGKFIVDGLHDKTIGTYRESWIDIYEKLYLEQPTGRGRGRTRGQGREGQAEEGEDGRSRGGQHGFDGHMSLGEGEPKSGQGEDGQDERDDGEGPISEGDLEREMHRARQVTAQALELARGQGKLPAAFQMFCEKVLEPVVDWTEHLKAQFARKLGSGGYDFRRPDRRLIVRDIICPGRSGYGANCVVLGMDSSGSIYAVKRLIDRWMAEAGGIMEEVRPREVHVVWCDAKVQRVDVLTDPSDVRDMFYKGAVGGGGTTFVPVFDYVESLDIEIDCLAYLTDGMGTFPQHPPRYPVIWGSIMPQSKYPFGDVVQIPVPKQ